MIKIRVSYEDGSESIFDYVEDYGTPGHHALAIMEGIFPDEAERGEIFSDGPRWYIEGVAEACWFEDAGE